MAVNFDPHEADVVDEIVVPEPIHAGTISDLLDAAFAGCDHWCTRVDVPKGGTIFVDGTIQDFVTTGLYKSQWLALGGVLTFIVDGKKRGLTRDMFADAVQAYCSKWDMTLTTLYDEHDFEMADAILQMALFGGEIVYG